MRHAASSTPPELSSLLFLLLNNLCVGDVVSCLLNMGIVPKEWKRVVIIPIYESGSKEEPLNYRLYYEPALSVNCVKGPQKLSGRSTWNKNMTA